MDVSSFSQHFRGQLLPFGLFKVFLILFDVIEILAPQLAFGVSHRLIVESTAFHQGKLSDEVRWKKRASEKQKRASHTSQRRIWLFESWHNRVFSTELCSIENVIDSSGKRAEQWDNSFITETACFVKKEVQGRLD